MQQAFGRPASCFGEYPSAVNSEALAIVSRRSQPLAGNAVAGEVRSKPSAGRLGAPVATPTSCMGYSP